MRIGVFGLWHLGCVTAACLARLGHQVMGLDQAGTIANLQQGKPPLHEPGLSELIAEGAAAGRLRFTSDPATLSDVEVLWVTVDTPVSEDDVADVASVRRGLEALADHLRPGTLVLISSQVPVGFTAALERDWSARGLRFAVSPENLRLGKAIGIFLNPDRIVVGVRDDRSRQQIEKILEGCGGSRVWMSVESAEMTKHALNAFLATSVTFINELARLCELVGADAAEVERGLKSEERIGPKAYLSPGGAFAGGTLARDVRFLIELGKRHGKPTPLAEGVWASNQSHKGWVRDHLARLLAEARDPVVTLLGLTYKPGTDTLRRSSSVELANWLRSLGVRVRAFDPAVRSLPDHLARDIMLCYTPADALAGSDAAVVSTPWPEFRALTASVVVEAMRTAQVLDPTHFLAANLGADGRIAYVATGRPTKASPATGQTRAA
jgi:UDPglucose 6-dehydrogenase